MKKKSPLKEPTISCKVALGMFPSEREVIVELADGRQMSALADKRDVIVEKDPALGSEVPGRVKVSIVEPAGKDAVIVDLPQPGLTEGPRVKVAKASLT
jgi:hypothetical protein